jgi:predicted phage baseplate assembly protein
VPYLYGSAPTDQVYALYRDKSGATVVQFGDGATFGARLPTGTENVAAVYRRGIGSAGLVGPDLLTMLATRPPGVRDVSNPLAANGAADPETVEQSRTNAPIAVRTLGRIVTLDDYADFVRASAGIAKARVDTAWRGSQRVIILTVAGPEGAPVVDGSLQFDALLAAIYAAAQADLPVALKSYRPRSFSVAAALVTDPAYVTDNVYAAVRAALWSTFSFDTREFGQPVFHSEVIAVIQGVPGVIAATLSSFCYTETTPATLDDWLDAQPAALSGSDAVGAELLTIDPIPAVLTVLS